MNSVLAFQLKHYYPSVIDIEFSKLRKLYSFLPVLITTFPEMPNINNFKRHYTERSNDQYVSIKKIEINIINTKNKTISNMFAHVYICFIQRSGKYYPTHVSRINFDTAIVNYTKPFAM